MLREAATPRTRLVDLPGRGTTRVWECAGPPGAETVMLIHGVAVTAALNWGQVFVPLGRDFRVVAADLRGHGDGIPPVFAIPAGGLRRRSPRWQLSLISAALPRWVIPWAAWWPSCCTGGTPRWCRGWCWTHRGQCRGSPAEQLAALAMPTVAAVLRWNPLLHLMGAEFVGMALLGRIDDPATSRWARAELSRTTLATVVSAMPAVSSFTSDSWLGQVDAPTAVVITARDRIVPPGRQLELARAVPVASVHDVDAGHGGCINAPRSFARALLEACWSAAPGRGSTLRIPA